MAWAVALMTPQAGKGRYRGHDRGLEMWKWSLSLLLVENVHELFRIE
jgi:hypothetical protein